MERHFPRCFSLTAVQRRSRLDRRLSQSPRPNSKSQVIVLSVLHDGLTPSQAALRFDISRRHLHRLLFAYKAGGLEALEPRSRRPKSNPRSLSQEVREAIISRRHQLVRDGLDAGAASIAWHLRERGYLPPALSTIWRTLCAEGLVTAQPKKRPKTALHRFEALQPNETWQSDFTHWRLKDGSDVEIVNWLDDHSRLLLHCSAHHKIDGSVVVNTFNSTRDEYGTPFSTLTDNGIVYTGRFVKGKNGFEYLLSELGVVQKNGSPGHPQTQGKIERFHQTLKKWLTEQGAVKDLKELQRQLDQFRVIYNTQRPHRALGMRTPQSCYEATIKATPQEAKEKEHYRIRHDTVDKFGKLTLRRAGKMHHLGVGIERKRRRVLIFTDHYRVTVVDEISGEIYSQHLIEPTRSYWTNYLVDEEEKRSRKPK